MIAGGWRALVPRGPGAGTLVTASVIAAAAIPFAGPVLPCLWWSGMILIAWARSVMTLASGAAGGQPEASHTRPRDICAWLHSAGYSLAAFYLVLLHSGPAQTLGVTLYGVVMFDILASDHEDRRRLLVNLTPPIVALVLIQAAAAYRLVQLGSPWQLVTLVASPFVVFQAFVAVHRRLAASHARERQVQAELRASESRYRLIAERSPDIIVRYDLDGNVEYLSSAARRYGWNPDDLTGMNITSALDPGDLERNAAFLAELKAGRPVPQGEENTWRVRSASGEVLVFEGRSAPVTEDDGRVTGAIAIVRDVTARLALEAELRRKKTEAEAASRAKSDFLATVSHEIRTPLNGVLGMVQAMAKDPLPRVQRERLDVIGRSGATLLALLNDILDLSKIEAGKLQLEAHDFDLRDLAGGVHAAFVGAAEAKGLSLDLAIEDAVGGVYRGDPVRVRQILYNLISNAVKFTEAGGIGVRIGATSAGVRITVSDTGIGIAPDHAPRLFEKFVQADATVTRRFGGSGLGLSICAELCRAMGGDITVESTVGQGSTFEALLPLERVAAPQAATPDDGPSVAALPATLQVLAAEDNPTNQLVLKTVLAQFGVDVSVVDDGAAAVAAWEQRDWDLILMDVQMPNMDGVSATRAIRAREAAEGRRRTPVVALTANAMSHQLAEYRLAGMDDLTPKPINVGDLVATIGRVLADAAADAPDIRQETAA